ncbi:uncharacterized protein F5Z01DRAFT_280637 [Emericellopsis atlantica]|uniref:Uncharacterized protein n=1 Tax=Emericellopsis atlantica TaxID=2614577 RepID=A0A9P7ZGV0_9HYPO|nr:uncharacterized protein F5Z01DRAFT_280637 [Emericellopsis atlantica]KAG9251432.1 hypothetical protein F5Z01DRAFT_280637 [Emericellopsis atlantica]
MTIEPEYVRLHITPLDSGLLKTYLPTSTSARNVSFHTIETFPEKRYGYVELPVAEADKLKKKLNGAVLKGSKVRIEKAKPPVDMGSSTKEEKRVKKDGSSKKRKREENVVDGVALSNRKVKRGWTESPAESSKRKKKDRSASKADKAEKKEDRKKEKQEKKRTKSKYTDGEECLLKTTVPPNATRNLPEEDKHEKKKRKKNSSSREVTVHEFEKTTKFPSFLKDEGVKGRAGAEEYVEGKGWVDAEGNVVEAVKEKEVNFPEKKSKKAKKQVVVEEDSDTSSSGSSSEEEEEDEEEEPKPKHPAKGVADDVSSDTSSSESEDETMVEAAATQTEPKPAPASDSDDTSSSGSDSEDGDAPSAKTVATPKSTTAHRPTSSSSLKIDIPPPPATPAGTVHPLEALYKRQKDAGQEEAPATQSFSFFGNGDATQDDGDEADDDVAPAVPMTPYTRQDFEWRNLRSAAPTPDTAHPSRMQNFWADNQDEDEAEEEDEEDEDEEDAAKPKDATSDFQSWFWDNRRDLNRSWMNRRKTAAKERRHRENKARASRAV